MKARMFLVLGAALLALAGCAGPQPRPPALEAAAREPLTCNGQEQCRRYWQRAQVWVATHSRWKVQTATDALIQTFTPVGGSVDLGYQIVREPQAGAQERILIKPLCDNIFGCQPEPFGAVAEFKAYVRQ